MRACASLMFSVAFCLIDEFVLTPQRLRIRLVQTMDRSLSEGERRKIGGMGMTGAFEKSLPKL
jgi:hypothetical protein